MFLSRKRFRYLRNRRFLPTSYQTSVEKYKEKITVMQFLRMLLKGSYIGIFFVTLTAIISSFFDFAYGPIFAQWFVRVLQNYTGPRSEVLSVLLIPLIVMVLTWVVPDLLWRIASWYYSKTFEPRLDAKIKITYLNRIVKNSYEYLTEKATGYVMSSLYKILFAIKCVVKKTSRTIIPTTITCIIMTCSLITMHWSLFLIMVSYIFFYILIFILTYKKIFQLQAKQFIAYSKNTSNLTDVLMNFSSVFLFSRKKYEIKRAKEFQNKESIRQEVANIFLEKLKIIRVILGFVLCGVLFYFVLFYLYINNKLEVADIVYSITASGECMAIIALLQEEIVDLIADFGSIQEGINIMNEGKIADVKVGGEELNIKRGEIKIENLNFSYGDKKLFVNQNLEIKEGEKVGIVGRSGAGKTTLINLILNNLTPISGKITINNFDLKYISDESIKNNISVVSQDTTLFNRSVFENIIYSKPDASFEEVVEASKKANAHDFIMNLEYGYNSNVGEKGMLLSGGQRQRILIARAILKNSPILVLDEATSALDAENELFIQKSLENLMEGKTVIAIAHKLNTLKQMDRIIVLQNGNIVEQGKHSELMKKEDGIYSNLWKIQKAATIMMDD